MRLTSEKHVSVQKKVEKHWKEKIDGYASRRERERERARNCEAHIATEFSTLWFVTLGHNEEELHGTHQSLNVRRFVASYEESSVAS
jgi:hypothetical protein